MTDPIPTWQQIRDTEDAVCYATAHASICAAVRKLMASMSEEDARVCRIAMLSGDSATLVETSDRHQGITA